MSIDVLGRVVEVVSKKSLGEFLETEIFQPLEMVDTRFQLPKEKLPRLVAGYVTVDTCLREVYPGEFLKEPTLDEDGNQTGIMALSSDYPYSAANIAESGGAGLSSTATDYMRFCQMLLNGGKLGDARLLREKTVAAMTSNQIGDLTIPNTDFKFGYGFAIQPDRPNVHPQLRNSYSWGGYWSTSFRISPRGDWVVVTMAQVAGLRTGTAYDELAAEAVEE